MIVADNPNPIEDMLGEAGRGDLKQLFQRFATSVNFYYTNLSKCHRRKVKLSTTHMRACQPYFDEEFLTVLPKITIALGEDARSYLLEGNAQRITRGAGYKSKEYGWVIPTWDSVSVWKQPWKASEVLTDILIAVNYCTTVPRTAKYEFSRNDITLFKECIEIAHEVAFDIETTCPIEDMERGGALDPVIGKPWLLTLSVKNLTSDVDDDFLSYEVTHFLFDSTAYEDGLWDKVGELLSQVDCDVVAQNGKFDLKWLRMHCLNWDRVMLTNDTQITHHLINENTGHSLNHLEWRYNVAVAGHKGSVNLETTPAHLHEQEAFEQYAIGDTASTLALHDTMECPSPALATMLAKASSILATTEAFGCKISEERLVQQLQETGTVAFTLAETLLETASDYGLDDFNPNSPVQVQAFLYDRLGLPKYKDETGKISTDDDALEILLEDCDDTQEGAVGLLRKYREFEKARQTLQSIREKSVMIGSDTVIRTNYQMSFVVTGRLSSREPNLQNIPKDGRIKQIFVPRKGHVFIEADYSQAEYRIAAQMAQDPEMIAALCAGADFHTVMQEKLRSLGVELDRGSTKNFNFALLYGAGYKKLSVMCKLSIPQVVEIQEKMKHAFPRFFNYIEGMPNAARSNGNAICGLFGRIRRVPYASSNNSWWRARADRQLINSPMQGGASDLTMNALVEVHDRYRESPINPNVVLTVHDSIVWEVEENSASEFADGIKYVMENPNTTRYGFQFNIPLKADIRILRDSWGEKENNDATV